MNSLISTVLTFCLPLGLLAPRPQDAADEPAGDRSTERHAPAERASETLWWQPEHADPGELAHVLTELVARGMMDDVERRDLQCMHFEGAVILHGSRAAVHAAVSMLTRLDASAKRDVGENALVVRELALRHVTMSDAIEALRPLAREVHERSPNGQRNVVPNLAYVHARGVVVVHDTQERVDRIADLLGRIDVPRPQLRVSAWLIRAADGDSEESDSRDRDGRSDDRIPAEAVEGLTAMVPYDGFDLVSFALLRSDGTSELTMSDSRSGTDYRLALEPESYDAEARRLTLSRCSLDIVRIDGQRRTTRSFTTGASLTAGEYVVLGGVGADADFLVLHLALESGD